QPSHGLGRPRPEERVVAAEHEALGALGPGVLEHGVERRKIAVHVVEHGQAHVRRASHENPRTAKKTPIAPHRAITPSAVRLSVTPLPVTIAPESPSTTCFSGSTSARSRTSL